MTAEKFVQKFTDEQALAVQLIANLFPVFYAKNAREDESYAQAVAVTKRVFQIVKDSF
jgi:hypothetical protein